MRILVVKFGALGDVIRTSYFASALRAKWGDALELVWLTAPESEPLLKFHPHIDRIATSFADLAPAAFDVVYSLDDEAHIVAQVTSLKALRIVGAFVEAGTIVYSPDSAPWFDMGLRSRLGKATADLLKRTNRLSHAQIFQRIFDVPEVAPCFFGDAALETAACALFPEGRRRIGINAFAGSRWPSKALRLEELERLVRLLLGDAGNLQVVLLGAGSDRLKNEAVAHRLGDSRVNVAATDESVLQLAAVVKTLDVLVSSDSLAMHCAIAQRVPVVAFFAPTSAAEIDVFGRGVKVASSAADYCSYRPDADNSSIVAERLYDALHSLQSALLDQPLFS
ncbi:MAG: glycosyltransferase family 9 protein [Pseudomonadota bacterium]